MQGDELQEQAEEGRKGHLDVDEGTMVEMNATDKMVDKIRKSICEYLKNKGQEVFLLLFICPEHFGLQYLAFNPACKDNKVDCCS